MTARAVVPGNEVQQLPRDLVVAPSNRFKRHVLEHFFCTLEHARASTARGDKTARSFLAAVYVTAAASLLD